MFHSKPWISVKVPNVREPQGIRFPIVIVMKPTVINHGIMWDDNKSLPKNEFETGKNCYL